MMMWLKLCLCLAPIATSLGAGEDSAYGQMGMTELLQMRDDLKARLDTGVRIYDDERDTWSMFKNLIQNTSIIYIEGEFEEQGNTINNTWGTVTDCSDALSSSKTNWPGKKSIKDNTSAEHNTCRSNQPDPDCNQTCTRCKDYVQDLVNAGGSKGPAPSGAVGTTTPVFEACAANDATCWGAFGDDLQNSTIYNWFKDYHDWHCEEDSFCPLGANVSTHSLKPLQCWQNCTAACNQANTNYDNNRNDCDDDQDTFEDALCDFFTTLASDCDVYTQCREGPNENDGADQDYLDKKTSIKTLEERLVVEYQIMKTIICYIDLLLRPNNEAISDGDKTSCEVYYPMPIPTLAIYYPDEYAPFITGWQQINCECNNFPNAATCSTPGLGYEFFSEQFPNLNNCTSFEDNYYKNQAWYNSVGTGCSGATNDPVLPTSCSQQRAIDRGCSP